MDQVKILLDNLQMVDPSFIFLPHKAKDRVVMESDLIATSEHVHDNYDFMRKYLPYFYVHKHDTYMYSNVIIACNKPQEELLRESSNILYGEHQAMYPRELQGGNCVITLYAGQNADGILVPLKRLSYASNMESNKNNTRRREGYTPAVACGN
jgi:hypothetical protein